MLLNEFCIGTTPFANKIVGYRSEQSINNKWPYCIAGFRGDEIEGPYILQQLLEWAKTSYVLEIPLIIIPILNMDGYLNHTRGNAHSVDLTNAFDPQKVVKSREPEVNFIFELFASYPPKILFTFQTESIGKMVTQDSLAQKMGAFLKTYNSYEVLEGRDHLNKGALEIFVNDFYLCPTLSLYFPKSNPNRSFQDLWRENEIGLKQLLGGQVIS